MMTHDPFMIGSVFMNFGKMLSLNLFSLLDLIPFVEMASLMKTLIITYSYFWGTKLSETLSMILLPQVKYVETL